MAIPDYADERAHKFFTQRFVGTRHGENGSSLSIDWDSSAEGLEPTAIYPNGRCVYCGNHAHPIQAGLRHPRHSYGEPGDRGYEVTGYACCCKGAMDEREHKARVEELKQRHEDELAALVKQAPVPDPDVFKAFAEGLAKKAAEDAVRSLGHSKDPVKLARKLAKQMGG